MTKYSFILYHMEVQTFLERVQEIGMVDITRENKVVDEHSKEKFALLERYATAEKSIKALSETLSEKNISSAPDLNGFSPEELLVSTEKSLEERIYLNSELKSMSRERDEAAQWGAFTKEDIDKISSLGYKMHCFVISESNYDSEWENKYIIHILSKKDGKCYFVILTKEDEELNFKYPESKFPTTSYHIIESKIEEVRLNIEVTEARLSSLLKMSEIMHSGAVLERASLDLHLAGVASVKEAEGTIAIMTGFAPADKREELHKFFENTGVYFIEDVAKEEDNPPIKLKNNFFKKL
ncbi:MAG: hypothetical protein PHV12_02330, partial [Bacteroidales bacterium]|nr:hypothetical protein [Bacteroidales bacterium]